MVSFLADADRRRRRARRQRDRTLRDARLPAQHHNASLAGHRSGSAVSFVKRYEPPGYGYNTVHYEGAVNADATEIDGRWSIRGTAFAGRFLMVRSSGPAQSVTIDEQVKAPVR